MRRNLVSALLLHSGFVPRRALRGFDAAGVPHACEDRALLKFLASRDSGLGRVVARGSSRVRVPEAKHKENGVKPRVVLAVDVGANFELPLVHAAVGVLRGVELVDAVPVDGRALQELLSVLAKRRGVGLSSSGGVYRVSGVIPPHPLESAAEPKAQDAPPRKWYSFLFQPVTLWPRRH